MYLSNDYEKKILEKKVTNVLRALSRMQCNNIVY